MARKLEAANENDGRSNEVNLEAITRVYVADLIALQAQQKGIADQIKARRKQAKADGVDGLQELDRIIKMSAWSPDEVRESFERTQRYAALLHLPIDTQGELFEDPRVPEIEQLRAKWRARGKGDGIKGIGWPESPPKECHADCHQAYGEGWTEGQNELLAARGTFKDAA